MGSVCLLVLFFAFRAVPGKKVLGGGTELENGGTSNTVLSFFYGTIHMDIPGNTPHPPNFN